MPSNCPHCQQPWIDGTTPDVAGSDRWTVCVPRHVVYMQGFLLGAVALVFFVFGMLVGNGARPSSNAIHDEPCVVSGTVLYLDGAQHTFPDESSVAIIVPASRPDQQASVEGLRPRDPPPDQSHPSLVVIRSIGGDHARVDRRGRYRLRVLRPGRYCLLIISRHAERADGQPPQASDLAQIGRYFLPAANLLDDQQYTWREILVRQDVEHDCTF